MSETAQTEILAASIAPSISESGGGHGQKGVDFQRYWAIARIIELAHSDEPDFLVLFESLQDVVEFNHSVHPTSAKVYQVKTKNTGDWTWRSLTALPTAKPRKRKNSTELTVPPNFEDSPIGKLTRTLAELDSRPLAVPTRRKEQLAFAVERGPVRQLANNVQLLIADR